ncbi:MAG: amidohydrolase [Saprospiraceae bacterium]|nr:amidohydrolase [Saprospiraceae bacterium]MBK8296538.1 amidohydrolase [Saprospiraceae bacterium]
MDSRIDIIKNYVSSIQTQLIELRRDLHAHPELSFQEANTSLKIQSVLNQLEIPHSIGWCKHGIVGEIQGNKPSGRLVALRADMDALPIHEKNQCSYKSKHEGVMHACGHDVHMTCLIGALRILNQNKDLWAGKVKFIFQPAEEKLPGGASILIEEGVLNHPVPDLIIGQHVQPGMEVGRIGIGPGAFMASCDEIYITIKGKGGHAAQAHLCIDPIVIASQLILALQAFMNREKPANQASVLSIGTFQTNSEATNIIPDEVKLSGTFRALDENWRRFAHQRIKDLTFSICKAFNATCDIDIQIGYPCLINNPGLTEQLIQIGTDYLGGGNVERLESRLTSEDFAYYSQKIPAVFYRLGVGQVPGVHRSDFDIDESAIAYGAGTMAYLAMSL